MTAVRRAPPAWYWIVAVLLLLWELMGIWSFWEHTANGPEAMGQVPTEYDRRLYAALPAWYVWVYAVAVVGGLVAGLALLLRRGDAVLWATVSLVATVVMFGWFFLATDVIAAKGQWTTYFPIAIVLVGIFTLVLARTARRRRWIG